MLSISESKRQEINDNLDQGITLLRDGWYRVRVQHHGRVQIRKPARYGEPGALTLARRVLASLREDKKHDHHNLTRSPKFLTLRQACNLLIDKHYALSDNPRAVPEARRNADLACRFFGDNTPVHEIPKERFAEFKTWRLKQRSKKDPGKFIKGSAYNKERTFLICLYNRLDEWKNTEKRPEFMDVLLPAKNPAAGVEPVNERKYQRTRTLTRDEYDNLMANCDIGSRRIVMAAHAMLRREKELRDMTMDNVDFARGVIRGLQSKRKRTDDDRFYEIKITPLIKELIESRPGHHLFDFTNWAPRWRLARRRAGISNLVLGDCRRTGATALLMAGEDLDTIRIMLGHADLETTRIYLGLKEDRTSRAWDKTSKMFAWEPIRTVPKTVPSEMVSECEI